MKVYIVCDLEGVAGIIDFKKQCIESGAYYQQAIRVATLELNALIEGLLEGGATEIYAWPGHWDFPGGIDFELIHPECKLVMHAGDGGPAGVDASFDAMIQHGLHGMPGAPGGIMSHGFAAGMWFDEQGIGEIAMNIYTLSEYDVPCIMVTGDQAAVDEARELIPNIEGVPVKWGLKEKSKRGAMTIRQGISLSPVKAREIIKEAAKRAIQRVDEFKPLKLKKPFTQKVKFIEPKNAKEKAKLPGVTLIDNVTISKECQGLEDLVF